MDPAVTAVTATRSAKGSTIAGEKATPIARAIPVPIAIRCQRCGGSTENIATTRSIRTGTTASVTSRSIRPSDTDHSVIAQTA